MDDLARVLGYRVGTLPTNYFSLLLGAPFNSSRIYNDDVEEKFQRQLAMWKRPYLSRGGRLTSTKKKALYLAYYLLCHHLSFENDKLKTKKDREGFPLGGSSN